MLIRKSSSTDVNKGHLERMIFDNHYRLFTNTVASDRSVVYFEGGGVVYVVIFAHARCSLVVCRDIVRALLYAVYMHVI